MMELLAMLGAFIAIVAFVIIFVLWQFMDSDLGRAVCDGINWMFGEGLVILVFSIIFLILIAVQAKIVKGFSDMSGSGASSWATFIVSAIAYAPIPFVMFWLWDAGIPRTISVLTWILPVLGQLAKTLDEAGD